MLSLSSSTVSQTLDTGAEKSSLGPFESKMLNIHSDFHSTFKKVIPENAIGNALGDPLPLYLNIRFLILNVSSASLTHPSICP